MTTRTFLRGNALRWLALAGATLLAASACSGGEQPPGRGGEGKESVVKPIMGKAQLQQALITAGDKLVLLDLYADWCGPCRMLSPILEEIARERADLVTVYKVNIDQNPDIAREYNVSGIPLVVFVKQTKRVHAVTGVYPRATYERAIERFAEAARAPETETADGELVDGTRVIRIEASMTPGNLNVHRGETVQLIFAATGQPFSVSIPQYGIDQSSPGGSELQLTFKAQDVGTFPMYCNGHCPNGEGERRGMIVVVPLASSVTTSFTEVTADEARRLIAQGAIVVDVRTPNEYFEGRLEGARLIPLQQLEGRVAELEPYREQPILLYCRSGNRSTVAAEILMRRGFRDLYNLRHGIQDWVKRGYPVTA